VSTSEAWRHRYAAKITTAGDAIRRIAPGQRIFVGSGAAAPQALVEALVSDGAHLADNEVVHIMTRGPAPYADPGMEARFRHLAYFIGENVRDAVQAGRADFVPAFLSEVPRLLASPRGKVDVALIQVSPPDEDGCVSLGVSVDVVRAAVDAASLVVAEVNPRMPVTRGESLLHASRIDAMIPVDRELPEHLAPQLDDVARAIGHHVSALIPDGATLQVGIGELPDAVLAALAGHHDLGVHSEMISDGVMKLARAGVINGRRKSLLPAKIVTSFLLGSRELYAWADGNDALELRPSDFTNDPLVVAQNLGMMAINGALAVDLTGQVAADTLGGRFFSGIGGQVDFVRGAARSAGGKPIIAMRSTAKGGRVSRVQPAFEVGAGVVTSRGDVHFVVTEYGVADLWGKSVRERALALVEIAHPEHRASLLAAAQQRRYVFADQRLPRIASAWTAARAVELPSREAILVRDALPSDEGRLQRLLYGLSDDSSRDRFFGAHPLHPRREVDALVEPDAGEIALVATCGDELVGHARATATAARSTAEIDVVVHEAWHHRGVGASLVDELAARLRERGVKSVEASTLPHNLAMQRLVASMGRCVESEIVDGVVRTVVALEPPRGVGIPSVSA
jgi:acyl-CoA hydrolase